GEEELLEVEVVGARPQVDVKPLAKELLAKFGSFADVIAAPPKRLEEVKGVKGAVVAELKIIEAAARRLAQVEVKKREVLSSWQAGLDHLRAAKAFRGKEAVPGAF